MPGVIPVATKSTVIVPELTIGDPVTAKRALFTGTNPTLVTPPPPPPPVELIVMFPVVPDRVIPVPALS